MQVKTVVSVLNKYDIKYRKIHSPEKGYRNEVWPIITKSGESICVVFYKTEPDILNKVHLADAVTNYLANQGLPCKTPLSGKVLQLQSNKRTIISRAYTYLPGQTISWESYSIKHLKILGEMLGTVHIKLTNFQYNKAPSVYDEYLVILSRMRRYFADPRISNAVANKLNIEVNAPKLDIYTKFLQHIKNQPQQQILHMDFVRGNILYSTSNNGQLYISGVLDFEKAGTGHIEMDLARTLAFLLVDCKYKPATKIYKYFVLSGYMKRSPQKHIPNTTWLKTMVELFLCYDLYKFLRHNPYEDLEKNEHFVRTRDILAKMSVIKYTLDLRETSSLAGLESNDLEPILSGGGVPVGTLTSEKLVLGNRNKSEEARILRKSSISKGLKSE